MNTALALLLAVPLSMPIAWLLYQATVHLESAPPALAGSVALAITLGMAGLAVLIYLRSRACE